jgi:hypothetical protein
MLPGSAPPARRLGRTPVAPRRSGGYGPHRRHSAVAAAAAGTAPVTTGKRCLLMNVPPECGSRMWPNDDGASTALVAASTVLQRR